MKYAEKQKYSNQCIFHIRIGNYVYIVPFVEEEDKIFLEESAKLNKYNAKQISIEVSEWDYQKILAKVRKREFHIK